MARKSVIDYQNEDQGKARIARPDAFLSVNVNGIPRGKPGRTIAEGERPLSRFLLADPDASTPDIDGDGSATPVDYVLTPDSDEVFCVATIQLSLIGTAMAMTGFGGLSGLTNGCLFRVEVSGTPVFDILGGFPLKTNGDIVAYQRRANVAAGTVDIIQVEVSPFANTLDTIALDGSAGMSLVFKVRDDLGSVGQLRIHCGGWIEAPKS